MSSSSARAWKDRMVETVFAQTRRPPAERICSLLPSATEIVCALGLANRLVGVTHECDFPPEATAKRRVTSSLIDSEGLSAAEIDRAVQVSLADQETIYRLDTDSLRALQPDLILTQELCTVCAVGVDQVREMADSLPSPPRVVSLEPRSLVEVLDSILVVGRLTGHLRRATDLVGSLQARLQVVRTAVSGREPVSVLTMEWIDPLFVGGHWVPEMVQVAGGRDVLGRAGEPSRRASWSEVVTTAPQVIVAMPCGFGLERSLRELDAAVASPGWSSLPAVQANAVYAVDGSSYFNRPGPRLVDGVEILAGFLHPDAYGSHHSTGFARFASVTPVEMDR